MRKLFQSDWVSHLIDALLPVFATLAALIVGAVMLLFLRVNPIEAYKALWVGAFGSSNAFAETLVKATPLLLVGIGICISFRGDVINIGGEGQMIIGAIFATWVGLTFTSLPGWLVITLAMIAGFIGGAVWGGIPGFLKAYFRVNEILSTVMMNAIAVQLMNFLLRGPFTSGCFDRSDTGDPGLHIIVAHNAGLPYPRSRAKSASFALCRDKSTALYRDGFVA
jgi:ABC-type uncharacterized transport system permease subunit